MVISMAAYRIQDFLPSITPFMNSITKQYRKYSLALYPLPSPPPPTHLRSSDKSSKDSEEAGEAKRCAQCHQQDSEE